MCVHVWSWGLSCPVYGNGTSERGLPFVLCYLMVKSILHQELSSQILELIFAHLRAVMLFPLGKPALQYLLVSEWLLQFCLFQFPFSVFRVAKLSAPRIRTHSNIRCLMLLSSYQFSHSVFQATKLSAPRIYDSFVAAMSRTIVLTEWYTEATRLYTSLSLQDWVWSKLKWIHMYTRIRHIPWYIYSRTVYHYNETQSPCIFRQPISAYSVSYSWKLCSVD